MEASSTVQRTRSLAALLRSARHTYALAVRSALMEAGVEDMPKDGVYALLAIRKAHPSAGDLARWLGLSKQAMSQLLDTLVVRDYVGRSIDPDDRRRVKLALSDRGMEIAAICRAAVDRVERRILETVGPRCVEYTRTTLRALVDLRAEWRSEAGSTAGD